MGNVLGGDLKLHNALSRLSELYWLEKDRYDKTFQYRKQSISPNFIQSDTQLTLLGNGAVCSAFAVLTLFFYQ